MPQIYRFDDTMGRFDQAYDRVRGFGQDRAAMEAGNALKTGDYAGASSALYGAGMLDAGSQVQAAASRAASNRNTADKNALDQQEALLKFTGDSAARLHNVFKMTADKEMAKSRVLAGFDQLAPVYKRYGETDEEIASTRAMLEKDPEGTLLALGAGVKHYQLAQGKDGYMGAFDPETAAMTDLKPSQPDPLQIDPNKDLYLPDQPGAVPDAPAPPTSADDPDAVWRSIKAQESGGDPTPGDAVGPDTKYGNALGSTQMLPATAEAMARKIGVRWDPRLMRENSPQALDYQDKLGRAYFQEGLDKHDGDPAAAAAYYFGGPDPALHGPKTKAYVQQVLTRARGGGAAQAPQPVAREVPGFHLARAGQRPGPAWTTDFKGNLVNTKTGDRKIDPTFEGGEADPNLVKMLIEGRYPVPTGRAAVDPRYYAALQAAAAQDPSFDAANYPTRVKTRQSFLNGKDAQNVTALNTVVGHLDALDHSIDHLGNFGGFPGSALNNRAAHVIARESGTDARLKDFEAKKTAVANELTRVFRGSGGAEADIQGYLKQIDTASSPKALHAAVRAMAELINSRLEAVADTYQQGMGLSKEPMEFLHPEQARAFKRLMGGSPAQGAPPDSGVIRYDAQGKRIR